jgi:hypothetical protein
MLKHLEEVWERRLHKRRAVVQMHKDRADYRAFDSARPEDPLQDSVPTTPCTRSRTTKRHWESEIQRWRERLRNWPLQDEAKIDDLVKSQDGPVQTCDRDWDQWAMERIIHFARRWGTLPASSRVGGGGRKGDDDPHSGSGFGTKNMPGLHSGRGSNKGAGRGQGHGQGSGSGKGKGKDPDPGSGKGKTQYPGKGKGKDPDAGLGKGKGKDRPGAKGEGKPGPAPRPPTSSVGYSHDFFNSGTGRWATGPCAEVDNQPEIGSWATYTSSGASASTGPTAYTAAQALAQEDSSGRQEPEAETAASLGGSSSSAGPAATTGQEEPLVLYDAFQPWFALHTGLGGVLNTSST